MVRGKRRGLAAVVMMVVVASVVSLAVLPPRAVGGQVDEASVGTLAMLVEVLATLSVRPVERAALWHAAAVAVVRATGDPYGAYMTQHEVEDFLLGIEGAYDGIGVAIESIDGTIVVQSVFPRSPASTAGLRAGDELVEADGKALRGMAPEAVAGLLRGPAGTPVRLLVMREGWEEPREIVVVREKIVIPSVESRMLGDGVGYVRIVSFREGSAGQFAGALEELRKQGELRALVLDLRDNGGGLVDEAVAVARQLVPAGPVVHIIGKQSSQVVKADGPGLGLPIVVLVNKGTASASEILAGALVDRCKAVLVGSPTFGKGSVQAVIPLGGGSAVRLTTAKYLTPNGHVIEGNPLKPQILVQEEDRGPRPKFSWRRPLKVLTVGLDVLAAQELLAWLGYPVGEADGIYGRNTSAQVSVFQREHGLPATGVLDEATARAMNEAAPRDAG
ncbi:MAG: S41 family peptidase, partial [Bacillota bacterium]